MAHLIQHLILPLLLVALFGAVAGWCWHCIRNKGRLDRLYAERDRLRSEFARQTSASPGLPGLREFAPNPELEAANMRAEVAVSKVVALERDQEDLILERDRLSSRLNEAEMALAAARADAPSQDWTTRIAALEDERDAAVRDLEDARLSFESERQSLLAAPVDSPAPTGPEVDPLEVRAQAWRVKLLEGRSEYLEARLNAAQAAPAQTLVDETGLRERDAEIARLQAELQAAVRRSEAPVTPAAPESDLNLLRWQARYLSNRVEYLEGRLRAEPAAVVAPALGALPEAKPEGPNLETLNRRAWRQRYLEARLAFYEGRWKEDRAARITALGDVQTRQSRLDVLEAQIADLHTARHEERTRLADVEATLAARTQERDVLAARLNERDEALSNHDALKAEAGGWQAERDRLAQDLTAVRARLGELDAAKADIARLRAMVTERDAEIARLKDQPAPALDETEVMHLRFRTRYLDDRVKFLEARLAAQPAARPSAPPRQTFMPAEPGGDEVRPLALPAARGGAPDDLRLIEGVSPRIESTLNSIGVYHFDQIAGWTGQNVAWVERYLAYKGRIGRERWVEQARSLARSDDLEVARRYREDEQV
jgi:predicted flap endonuclease-1-like 5' DNA nuclease